MEQIIAGQNSGDVIDVTMDNFMAEVVEASNAKVVLLQFWASWCGPCKALGPILEKVAASFSNVRVARVNIDENEALAQQMRVQSVPAVFGVVGGRPIDGFAGAQPESAVRQFVEKLVAQAPGVADILPLIEAGKAALSARQGEQALDQFQQALAMQPDSLEALSGMVRALVMMGELESAREIVDSLDEERQARPEMQDAISAIELAEKSGEAAGETAAFRAAIEANPDDLQAYQDLALALYAAGQTGEAMEILLASIKKDKDWQEGAARTQLFEIFSALGPMDKDVIAARRKLSTYLFS
ncbi:MAG: tetratricopeptide repeat protein [Candidatus Puniceispirillaceae bacterium]